MISNIQDLYFFTVIVESGSFTKAAKKLGVPKSKISRRLQSLESQIGSQLVVRTTRSQELTETGKLLYQRCQPLVESLTKVEQDVGDMLNSPKGKLHVMLPLEFFNRTITELISDFAQLYPEIELICSHYDGLLPSSSQLADITFILHEQPLPPSDWIAKSLLSFTQGIFISCDESDFEINQIDELSDKQCIRNIEEDFWLFRDKSNTVSVPIKGRIQLSSPQMRLEAALKGCGLVKLPHYVYQLPDIKPLLKEVSLCYPPAAQELSVIYQSRTEPMKTRVFLEFFQANIGKLNR